MTTLRTACWLACLACLLVSCAGDTGRAFVELPLRLRGESAEPFAAGDWQVQLERADVAVGPLYLCATESADSSLCDVAIAERREVVVIDGLDPNVRDAGKLAATTGSIRSGFFDYGISWLLTEQGPRPMPGSPGGHSAVFVGEASRGDERVRFRLAIDIEPIAPGDAAVNARRTRHDIEDPRSVLTLGVRPSRWLSEIDFDAWLAERDDDDDVLGAGPGDPPYETVIFGMTVNDPVVLAWTREEGVAP